MRALVALGGNALLRRGEPAEAAAQGENVAAAATALAGVAREHELVLTHGGGPEVGGVLELALRNELPERDLVTVLSAVVVDPEEDASEPQAIVELRSLRTLIDAGVLVICAGGGGIPVALDGDGSMHGVEAAVDTDLTAALLARRLEADVLVLLTDVDAVRPGRGGAEERSLGRVTPEHLRRHDLASPSMGAKVDAACRFVEATGRRAAIGRLSQAVEVVRGESGTQIIAPSP